MADEDKLLVEDMEKALTVLADAWHAEWCRTHEDRPDYIDAFIAGALHGQSRTEREYSVQLSWLQVTKLRAWLGEPRWNPGDNWAVTPNGSLPLGRVNFEAVMGGGILVRTQPYRSTDG